jgi:VWFA-related protein
MLRKALVVLLLCLAGTLHAQRFGEAVEVSIVEVPVTVVDRAGNPVQGLTRESFEIYDDGRRVPIEYFEVLDLATVTASPGHPIPPVAYRNFLLLFDLANSKPGTIARAQTAARSFLEGKLTVRDLVGVAVYTPSKGLRMLASFSADRKLVMDAIETLGSSVEFKIADPLLLAGSGLLSAPLGPGGGGGSGRIADAKADQESDYVEQLKSHDRATVVAQTSELTTRVRSQLQNMGGMARALDQLHGQKQVILLSEGFDPRLITGRQELSGQKAQEENAAIASGEIWKVDSDERYGSAGGVREINDMAGLFRRSDVRLHAIDIKGLRSDVDAREGVLKSSNEALFMLTEPTGGTVFQNANDLGSNFDRLLKRQQYVYLLGITSKASGKPGQFHTIKVKTTVRGAEVAHRSGYHEDSLRANDLERTLGLAEILVKDTPVNDVPVTLFASAAPGTGSAARVPVVMEISGPKLLQGVTGANATANIFVYAFDERQQVRDFMQQRVVLDVAKTGDMLRKTGVRYVGALRLEPGTYAIKALVRIDETGRTGFLRTNLEVPVYSERAVLQPLAMGDATGWVTLLSPTRGQDAASLFSIGPDPFVPSSPAPIAAGIPLRFALMVYRTPLADLGVASFIVSPGGATREAAVTLVGRTQPDAVGVTKLVFEFKPDGLPQGPHELRLSVTPKDSPTSTVSLPFVIR